MIRAVLDTNVLVSAVLDRTSTPGNLLLLWTYEYFELLLSEHIIDEFARTLSKPYFQQRLSSDRLSDVLTLLQREGRSTPILERVEGVATHPEDDLVLATALSGHADYLVTGDTKLLRIGVYGGFKIISPREFLEILGQAGE